MVVELRPGLEVKVMSCKGTYLTASEDRNSVTLQKERFEWENFQRNSQYWRVVAVSHGTGTIDQFHFWSPYDKVLAVDRETRRTCQKHRTQRPYTLGWALIETPNNYKTTKLAPAHSGVVQVLLKAEWEGYAYFLRANDADGSVGLWGETVADKHDPCFHWTLQLVDDATYSNNHHHDAPPAFCLPSHGKPSEHLNGDSHLPGPEDDDDDDDNAGGNFLTGHNINVSGTQNIGGVAIRNNICRNGLMIVIN